MNIIAKMKRVLTELKSIKYTDEEDAQIKENWFCLGAATSLLDDLLQDIEQDIQKGRSIYEQAAQDLGDLPPKVDQIKPERGRRGRKKQEPLIKGPKYACLHCPEAYGI